MNPEEGILLKKKKQTKGRDKREDACSPGKAFGLSSDALFTVGRILVKINYRQKQFNTYCQRRTNGLELVG